MHCTLAMYKCYNRFNPRLIFPRNNGDFGYCSRDQVLLWKYMIIINFIFDQEATICGFLTMLLCFFQNRNTLAKTGLLYPKNAGA